MLVRAWRVVAQSVVAIVGILILAGLIGVTFWTAWLVNHRQNTAEQNAADYAKRAEASIQQNCTIADLAARQECKQEKIRAADEAERSEYDLAAQQDVADWTQLAVYVGVASILVGVGGIVVVWLSLKQGKEGLKQGRRGVKAAEAAIAVTREMSQRELRAYVSFEDVFITAQGDPSDIRIRVGFTFSITFKNFGVTPARSATISSQMHHLRKGQIPLRVPNNLTINPKTSFEGSLIGPGMTQRGNPMLFTLDYLRSTFMTENIAVICSRIDYLDIFDQERFAEACFAISVVGDPNLLLSTEGIQADQIFLPVNYGPHNTAN